MWSYFMKTKSYQNARAYINISLSFNIMVLPLLLQFLLNSKHLPADKTSGPTTLTAISCHCPNQITTIVFYRCKQIFKF
ncbi:hypothetical protein Hanom_Chr07g00662871 [Helianthus anomalus]